MKRIIMLIAVMTGAIYLNAQNNVETYNIISDSYKNALQDTVLIRNINGGTVIIPVFDSSCPEEMKAPFSFACKIVEEYMPPCMPIKVGVSCGSVNSQQNVISRVAFQCRENFGRNADYRNAPLSMIKGVILAENGLGSGKSYLDSVPNVEFLTQYNDIEITYDERKLEELSFTLNNNPGECYDFVSVAIRDILIGLGMTHNYTCSGETNGLINPEREMIPFELYIDRMLGYEGNDAGRLENAMQGEMVLYDKSRESLRLYAPNPWQNGVSLNYFIPQDDSDVSNILSYGFCKGMVTRSLNDGYANFIFLDLLGWRPGCAGSSDLLSVSAAGSTCIKMPYKGSISFCDSIYSKYGITYRVSDAQSSRSDMRPERSMEEDAQLMQYVDSFHPFLPDGNSETNGGVSVAILKKDGTWDSVYYVGEYHAGMSLDLNMSDCEFHFDDDEYARTIDGYLRGRITTKKMLADDAAEYHSTFFVIDYLPQKVKLTCKLTDTSANTAATAQEPMAITYYPVRIYFSDFEGADRIVLERRRKGFRVPSKIEVTDFKKGYFDLTIDRETTFTAIAYNANGSSRSVPVTVTPGTDSGMASATQISISGNEIRFYGLDGTGPYRYIVTRIDGVNMLNSMSDGCDGYIDISTLPDGLYILTVTDASGNTETFKFKK